MAVSVPEIMDTTFYILTSLSSLAKQPFLGLRRFYQICIELDHLVFTSLDFTKIFLLQCKVINLASKPTWRTVSVFMHPQAPGSIISIYE
jgi:hypothetical protein